MAETHEIEEYVWILVHEMVDRATGAYYEPSSSPSITSSSPSTSSLSSSSASPLSSPLKSSGNYSALDESVPMLKENASKNVSINPFSRPNRFRMGVNTGAADVILQLRNDLEQLTKERDYWRGKCEEMDQLSARKKRKSSKRMSLDAFSEIEQ